MHKYIESLNPSISDSHAQIDRLFDLENLLAHVNFIN
jgi:hypothetical protein